MDIYKINSGRYAGQYIRAQFDEQRNQYVSTDIRPDIAKEQFSFGNRYCYTYGGSPRALAEVGIKTYATLALARRADGKEDEESVRANDP